MSKILVNALQFSKDGAGISRYSHKLSEELIKKNDNIDVLCRNEVMTEFYNQDKLISIDINKSSDRILKEQILNLKLYKNYDLVHFLDYSIPAFYKGKKIATIHDMAMHTMEDKYTKGQIITKKMLLDNTIKYADKLICISKFTSKELLKYYPNADESKIEVVYNGFEYKKIEISEITTKNVLHKFNIQKKYLLFVGTISPHKNIERLVNAFNEIKRQGYNYQLIICGKKGWLYEDIFEKVKQLKLENEVIFTGYVTDEELEVLYRNAKLFVFPSLYEGFGFPPIEAMARKVPVISSREGALPEIVSEAAIMCDAYDVEDIAKKCIYGICNDELRKKIIDKGLKRAEFFSWHNTSNKVREIYEEILNT